MDKFTPNRRYRTENFLFKALCVVGAVLVVAAVLSLIFGW